MWRVAEDMSRPPCGHEPNGDHSGLPSASPLIVGDDSPIGFDPDARHTVRESGGDFAMVEFAKQTDMMISLPSTFDCESAVAAKLSFGFGIPS